MLLHEATAGKEAIKYRSLLLPFVGRHERRVLGLIDVLHGLGKHLVHHTHVDNVVRSYVLGVFYFLTSSKNLRQADRL